jgi:hypothetical protein
MMNIDEINDHIHEIAMMVSVLVNTQAACKHPTLTGASFKCPARMAKMISFASLDIHKRVQALQAALLLHRLSGIPTHVVVPSVSLAAVPHGRAGTILVDTPSSAGLAKPVRVPGGSAATPWTPSGTIGGDDCPVIGGETPAGGGAPV